jgi:hypothetical protein
MEACAGDVRDVADTLMKVISAFRAAGVEVIGDHERSDGGGKGVRFAHPVGLTGRTH